MGTLYVDTQGAYIRIEGDTVRVERQGETVATLPLVHLDLVFIVGQAQLSSQAIRRFLRDGIKVAFLSRGGDYQGKLSPATHKNIFLRLHQYRKYDSSDFRMSIARTIIWTKVKNCLEFLHKHQRSHPETLLAQESLDIKGLLRDIWHASGIAELMGLEGVAARHYFSAMGKMIRREGFSFTGRNRRPPRDGVNSLLSLGYTLLYHEVLSAVESIGLDPYLGFLHEPDYGRASLATDLQEEFRYLIDELVLAHINHGAVHPDDFEIRETDGACYMKPEARKHYYAAYETKMRSKVAYGGQQLEYRMIFRKQAEHLARLVQDQEYVYEPFMMK